MNELKCRFELTEVSEQRILLTDLNGRVSLTNDVENVVRWLYNNDILDETIPLYYIDSSGERTEIIHHDESFVGFRTWNH